jgi:hypothetical protein
MPTASDPPPVKHQRLAEHECSHERICKAFIRLISSQEKVTSCQDSTQEKAKKGRTSGM